MPYQLNINKIKRFAETVMQEIQSMLPTAERENAENQAVLDWKKLRNKWLLFIYFLIFLFFKIYELIDWIYSKWSSDWNLN